MRRSPRRIQIARRNVGAPVFGGMIAASFLGIFVIPPLYVLFQGLREKLRRGARPRAATPPGGAQAPPAA